MPSTPSTTSSELASSSTSPSARTAAPRWPSCARPQSLLADSVATTPPDSLRDSVLAGISQIRPLPPEVTPSRPSRRADRLALRRHRRRPVWTTFLVAAALIVVAGVGIATWRPWAGPGEVTADQVIQAADAQESHVDLGEAGSATIVRSKATTVPCIITEDMVSAPAGKDYELWFLPGEDEFVPAGLMPDAARPDAVLEGSAAEAIAVGITVEPDGGSEQPTSDPIALFDLSEDA